jgi:hypothetical protein
VNISSLVSPVVPITSTTAQLKFRNNFNTESTFDGEVVEMKVDAGAFQDILAAGGTFVSGGYNATISNCCSSPIAGRQAWSGASGGYVDTIVNLPASANGHSVQFRWRMASDSSVSVGGVNVDGVSIVNSFACQGVNVANKTPFDFDGDHKTDIAITRVNGAVREWWISRSSDSNVFATGFGAATDIPAPADFTGDGKADIAIFRPSTGQWFILKSEDFTFLAFPFGTNGDIPAPADYDGDGKADAAVFRPSAGTWFISPSGGGATIITQFGTAGDQPAVADYDNDGKADIAITRTNGGNKEWWVLRSSAGLLAVVFGVPTDKATPGDFTGDGKADIAFFRPTTGQWFILRSEDLAFLAFTFGQAGDIPAPGDYDGDGKFDSAVFRPGTATWFINRTGGGGLLVQAFGAAPDTPVPAVYVR